MTVVPHTVNRLVIEVAGSLDEFRARFEEAVPQIDPSAIPDFVGRRAPWDEVVAAAAEAAPHGFLIYWSAVATALIAASTISPAVASPSDPAYKALSDQRQELLHQYDRVWKEADDIKYEINQLRRDSHEFTRAESDLERELQYKNDDLHRIENTIHDLDKAMI